MFDVEMPVVVEQPVVVASGELPVLLAGLAVQELVVAAAELPAVQLLVVGLVAVLVVVQPAVLPGALAVVLVLPAICGEMEAQEMQDGHAMKLQRG